jgi:hypothetical protein
MGSFRRTMQRFALAGLAAFSSACAAQLDGAVASPDLAFATDAPDAADIMEVGGGCWLTGPSDRTAAGAPDESGVMPGDDAASRAWVEETPVPRVRWRTTGGALGGVGTLSGARPTSPVAVRIDADRVLVLWNEQGGARAVTVRESPSTTTTGRGLVAFVTSDAHGFDPGAAAAIGRLFRTRRLACTSPP